MNQSKIAILLKHLYEEETDFYDYVDFYEHCEDQSTKNIIHTIAQNELDHYKVLHELIFAAVTTEFEQAVKENSICKYKKMVEHFNSL